MGYSSSQAKEFIRNIAPVICQEADKRGYGIRSTVIAQAIVEGACGTSKLARDYHNHFGMKCGTSWKGKSINMKTKEEYTPGVHTTIKDNFRAYDTDVEGVAGYYDFINTKRYANLRQAKDYTQYAEYLKKDGWATSSVYIQTLCETVKRYSLWKYDVETVDMIKEPVYETGKVYTTQVNLNIRYAPDGMNKPYDEITESGKEHSYQKEKTGFAVLLKDTRVTCKSTVKKGDNIWMEIPSGYIAAYYDGKVYVK